jgi:hypothetical protein
MEKTARFFALIFIFIFLTNFSLISSQDQAIHEDNPSTLDKYDVVARGKMSRDRGKRPVQIARMDNNGEILLACLEAKTVDELKSKGITFKQSQMELLVDWNLLDYDSKATTYRTTIHVYGPEKAAAIRKLVNRGVVQLIADLGDELNSLIEHLDRIDRKKICLSFSTPMSFIVIR